MGGRPRAAGRRFLGLPVRAGTVLLGCGGLSGSFCFLECPRLIAGQVLCIDLQWSVRVSSHVFNFDPQKRAAIVTWSSLDESSSYLLATQPIGLYALCKIRARSLASCSKFESGYDQLPQRNRLVESLQTNHQGTEASF